MNYKEIAKETIGNLYKAHHSIIKSVIDKKLLYWWNYRSLKLMAVPIAAVITLKNYPILALNRMSSTGNIPIASLISKSLF